MRKGLDGGKKEKKTGGKKERRPLERRPLMPIIKLFVRYCVKITIKAPYSGSQEKIGRLARLKPELVTTLSMLTLQSDERRL